MLIYEEARLKNDPKANFGRQYQQCTISVMDTIADPNITFDDNGISNYYNEYKRQEAASVLTGVEAEQKLQELVTKIKASGARKKYDCITGVSGGVDSTYLALQAKKLGLRPLIVHFDNGWNSAIAVKNIEQIIHKLGFDLYTLVVDWAEFRDLQLAYLKASVVDIEALTDHAIIGTLYKLAAKFNIKYILSGNNVVTEATLPSHWIWSKTDHRNIQAIHKHFGTIPLKTFPFFNTLEKKYYGQVKGIEIVCPLNYLSYNKAAAIATITKELDWLDYGGKHCESVFTRFYQGYILPVKFGIDKRKAHLSNLIFSGQMDKSSALSALSMPIYKQKQMQDDYEFVLKKFNLTEHELDTLMHIPRQEHSKFDFEKSIWDRHPILNPLRPLWRIVRR